jgi:Xaa-Pro aminopeptidase
MNDLMKNIRLFAVVSVFCAMVSFSILVSALDRQPGSDYRARREKLAAKLDGGVALVFAPPEAEGPNALYGYRPDDNFYYLTGWAEPGAALLVVSSREAKGDSPARSYSEILFLPNRNSSEERWTGP